MKIYFSGVDKNPKDLNDLISVGATNFMLSYYYQNNHKTALNRIKSGNYGMMLDSGAFSAWRKGVEIDLQSYIDYIHSNGIEIPVALDVIGDPVKTFDNYREMINQGLGRAIPTFHLGSDWAHLDRLVNIAEIVGIGGTVGSSAKVKKEFFDEVFKRHPDHKFHGFGIAAHNMLVNYPWYSVDSTAWNVGKKLNKYITEKGYRPIEVDMSISEKVQMVGKFLVDLENKLNERRF